MESGLQELKFSRYNQKVELSGKLFLYNALTGGYASVDEEYRDNFDKCDFISKRLNFRHGYKNPRPHFCNRSTLIIHI